MKLKYIVITGDGIPIAVKESMDDALDVVESMKSFDRVEGLLKREDWYRVEIKKEYDHGKD